MISISETAQGHFRNLLAKQPEGTNIRVFVMNAGTPQAECGVSYCPPDAVEPEDLHLPFEGFEALIDPQSIPFLEEAAIDFVSDQMGSQLTLKAPNAKMRKVNDDAPLVERIEYVIHSQVNPSLAGHGGKQGNTARVLRFVYTQGRLGSTCPCDFTHSKVGICGRRLCRAG